MAASASSRDQPSRVPVTTTGLTWTRFWGTDGAAGPSKFTPAARSFVDHDPIGGQSQELMDAGGDLGPTTVHGGQLIGRRGDDAGRDDRGPWPGPRSRCRPGGGCLNPSEEPVERPSLRLLDGAQQVGDRLLTEALPDRGGARPSASRMSPACVLEQAELDEQRHPLLSQAFDVHLPERDAKWAIRWTRCAWALGGSVCRRCRSLPPTSTAGDHRSDRVAGNATVEALWGGAKAPGPTTSGMTSPAFRTVTVVAGTARP